jgi:hypothetical protein
MRKETVARNNTMFFVVAVGMSLGLQYFAQALMDSFMQDSQFPTDNVGSPGYIKIDSSSIWVKGDNPWYKFAEEIRNGLLTMLSYEFSSATEFEGDLAERVTLEKNGYVFSFHIKQYERDAEHSWEIIDPKNLEDIPEEEILGRVAYLSIKPKAR